MVPGRLLSSILARADAGARVIVMVCSAVMVVVVFAQVVMRYVFNGSFDWADEVSRLGFVWMIFLGIPLRVRDGTHVSIDLIVSRFPPALRRLLYRVMCLLAAAMMALVFWISIDVALATWSERLGAINITSSIFFFPIILGALHSAAHLVALVIEPAPKPSPKQSAEPSLAPRELPQ